jgi:hypothetical protein
VTLRVLSLHTHQCLQMLLHHFLLPRHLRIL